MLNLLRLFNLGSSQVVASQRQGDHEAGAALIAAVAGGDGAMMHIDNHLTEVQADACS